MGKCKDKAFFYHTVFSMLDAGVPLSRALKHLYPGCLRRVAVRMGQKAEHGMVLSEIMKTESVFSDFECLMVRVGEQSGRMTGILASLEEWFNMKHSFHQILLGGLAYPLFVYFIAGFLLTVIRFFTAGISIYGCVLELILWYAQPLVWIIIAKFCGFIIRRVAIVGCIIDCIPFVGKYFMKLETAGYFKSMECCTGAGMVMSTSMSMSAEVCYSAYYRKKFRQMADYMAEKHCPVSEAFQKYMTGGMAASEILPVLSVGEATGTIDEACARLTKIYQEESRRTTLMVARLAPVAGYLLFAMYLAFRIISFYAGYISLINELTE